MPELAMHEASQMRKPYGSATTCAHHVVARTHFRRLRTTASIEHPEHSQHGTRDEFAKNAIVIDWWDAVHLRFVDGVFRLAEPNMHTSLERDLCNLGSGMWRCGMAVRMTLLCP